MNGPASSAIGQTVPPGGSIDVSVKLKAPAATKTYQGKWMLQTDTGTTFGLGANADGSFWVKIKVDQALAVTAASVTVAPAAYTGPCPGAVAIYGIRHCQHFRQDHLLFHYFLGQFGFDGTGV